MTDDNRDLDELIRRIVRKGEAAQQLGQEVPNPPIPTRMGQVSQAAQTQAPSPAPSPAPPQAATGASPQGARYEEDVSQTGGYSTSTGQSQRFSPQTDASGTDINESARRANQYTPKREEDEEDEIAKAALSGLFGAIVSKYADPRNPTATVAMRKEFDDAIKQVFQPKGGTDNFVNLRSPGQPPAKIIAEGDDPSSASNTRGKLPRTATGIGTGGKPADKYQSGYDQAYENPERFGSGYVGSLPQDGTESYGDTRHGSGISGQYPQPKPSRGVTLDTGRTTAQRVMGRGAPQAFIPTERDVQSGTYGSSTRITTETSTPAQSFSKELAASVGLKGENQATRQNPFMKIHGVTEQHPTNKNFDYRENAENTPVPSTWSDTQPDERESLIKAALMAKEEQDTEILKSKTIRIRIPKQPRA